MLWNIAVLIGVSPSRGKTAINEKLRCSTALRMWEETLIRVYG